MRVRVGSLRAAAAFSLVAAMSTSFARGEDLYVVDAGHSSVSFEIRHLLTRVHGKFSRFEGTIVRHPREPRASSVRFTIEADSIDTANPERDRHLRSADFFDVGKYPLIEFASTTIEAREGNEYEVKGLLTLHGVAREIALSARFLGEISLDSSLRAGFEASTILDRKLWGITWNQILDQGGTILGDDVTVDISLETVKQPQPEPGG